MSTSSENSASRHNTLLTALCLATVYVAVHFCARLLASPNLGEDDPFSNVYTQTLQLGYAPKQPPLYDWVLWGLQQLTGPTLVSFLILKYSLLIATVGFVYASARRVIGDPLWAMLTADSMALIYHIGWRFHE